MDGSSDTKELKRKYSDFIRKTNKADGAPKATGHEVAGWVKNGQHYGKVQGKIQDLKVLKGNVIVIFF